MLLNVKPASSGGGEVALLWGSLKVLVVLMETVEVVRVPVSNREKKIKNLQYILRSSNCRLNKLTF